MAANPTCDFLPEEIVNFIDNDFISNPPVSVGNEMENTDQLNVNEYTSALDDDFGCNIQPQDSDEMEFFNTEEYGVGTQPYDYDSGFSQDDCNNYLIDPRLLNSSAQAPVTMDAEGNISMVDGEVGLTPPDLSPGATTTTTATGSAGTAGPATDNASSDTLSQENSPPESCSTLPANIPMSEGGIDDSMPQDPASRTTATMFITGGAGDFGYTIGRLSRDVESPEYLLLKTLPKGTLEYMPKEYRDLFKMNSTSASKVYDAKTLDTAPETAAVTTTTSGAGAAGLAAKNITSGTHSQEYATSDDNTTFPQTNPLTGDNTNDLNLPDAAPETTVATTATSGAGAAASAINNISSDASRQEGIAPENTPLAMDHAPPEHPGGVDFTSLEQKLSKYGYKTVPDDGEQKYCLGPALEAARISVARARSQGPSSHSNHDQPHESEAIVTAVLRELILVGPWTKLFSPGLFMLYIGSRLWREHIDSSEWHSYITSDRWFKELRDYLNDPDHPERRKKFSDDHGYLFRELLECRHYLHYLTQPGLEKPPMEPFVEQPLPAFVSKPPPMEPVSQRPPMEHVVEQTHMEPVAGQTQVWPGLEQNLPASVFQQPQMGFVPEQNLPASVFQQPPMEPVFQQPPMEPVVEQTHMEPVAGQPQIGFVSEYPPMESFFSEPLPNAVFDRLLESVSCGVQFSAIDQQPGAVPLANPNAGAVPVSNAVPVSSALPLPLPPTQKIAPEIKSDAIEAIAYAGGRPNDREVEEGRRPSLALIHLESDEAAAKILDAALAGHCSMVKERPQNKDSVAKSGHVYLFEVQGNLQRWNDALNWSPSRKGGRQGDMIYRQTDHALTSDEKKEVKTNRQVITAVNCQEALHVTANEIREGGRYSSPAEAAASLVGALTGNFPFENGGLVKRVRSFKRGGKNYSVVAYYSVSDVVKCNLLRL